MHHHTKKGFSIVEVLLVLAITGLVFVGIVSGINVNVSRQRYNDAVQDFAEFLRRVYSEVTNVQNPLENVTVNNQYCTAAALPAATVVFDEENNETTKGRSECAFYGKLISFGENTSGDDKNLIYIYDVIGKVYNNKNYADDEDGYMDSTMKQYLEGLKSDIFTIIPDGGSECTIQPFASMYSYRPQWEAEIQTTDDAGIPFRGQVLIARSPVDNSVHTLSRHGAPDDDSTNYIIEAHNATTTGACNESLYSNVRNNSLYAKYNNFHSAEISFCVASDDVVQAGNTRRNIQIANGSNSSAVRLINTDDETENECS